MILVWVTGIGVASAVVHLDPLATPRRAADPSPVARLGGARRAAGAVRVPRPPDPAAGVGQDPPRDVRVGAGLPVAQPPPARRLAGRDRHLVQPRRDRRQRWLDAGQHGRVAQGGDARDPARGVRELTCAVVAATGDAGRRLLRTGVVAAVERVQHRRRADRRRFDVPRPSLVLATAWTRARRDRRLRAR